MKFWAVFCKASRIVILTVTVPLCVCAQQGDQTQPGEQSSFVLKVNSDLVLTNVVVRDKKSGEIVHGLTEKDFSIEEDGKPQQISSFDFEDVDKAAVLNEKTVSGKSPNGLFRPKSGVASPDDLHNRRLIVLFFDNTTMQPADLVRAQDAARNYIDHQMQPADLVAVVSLGNALTLNQDFTADKHLLLNAVNGYSSAEESGYDLGATSTTNQVEDATAFTADESEFNDINTDRELFAIEEIAKSLSYINEKKSLLYFSGGIQRNGIENQASLTSAVNAAVRGNLSIYSVDTRGLQAISPLGDATAGSLRGINAYNGVAVQNNFDTNFNTQEVMASLSDDTGGKALFDSNDFSSAFKRIQEDTSAYYVLGFFSTDTRRDGRYRNLTIKVDRGGVKLEYRPGYYAPADYKHSTKEEREQELRDELASSLPDTDVAVYLQALYFRLNAKRYFVPVSLVVPVSQIPFVKGGDHDKATLDIIGQVKDATGHDVGDVRQTVKLSIDESQQVRRKNVQYTTSFTLPPGTYQLKFVVRENETGHMGSFEAKIEIPDLSKAPLKLSSVVLSSQRMPTGKKTDNPLVRDGKELVPNLSHVFLQNQHLYLLYEVYDPAHSHTKIPNGESAEVQEPGVPFRVFTNIEFLARNNIAFATPTVQGTEINVPARDAIAFEFDIPLTDMKPGSYTCQVNVVDDTGGTFSFPRIAVLIRSALTGSQLLEINR